MRTKTLTQIEAAILRMDAEICALTGLSWEELNTIRFETAYEFLEKVMGVDAYGLEVMPKTSQFWNWWSNQWLRVDELYVSNLRFDVRQSTHYLEMRDRVQVNAESEERRLAYWKDYHEASRENYYIDEQLVHLTYHQLIKTLVK